MPAPPVRPRRLPHEPTHLVVFNEPGRTGTTGVLCQCLGVKTRTSRRVPGETGVVSLPARAPGSPPPIAYESLGLAALDLDESEVAGMRATKGVLAVVRNEIRSLPPVPEFVAAFDSGIAIEAEAGATWGLEMIGAATSTYTGRGVSIAVLDSGIDLGHPDLSGKVLTSRSFVPGESVDDGNGHGTHCCGTAGGPLEPFWGPRYGVAPDAPLIVGKVLANNGSGYDSWILSAMAWAAEAGARVVSMSLGSARKAGEPFNAAYERVASVLRERGVLVVAAAGNESRRPGFVAAIGNPAAAPSILAIAAIDSQKRVASFSCGEVPNDPARLTLAAPGVGIHSAWPRSTYRTISGTSMACPHVAGAAALYFEQNPAATPAEIETALVASALATGAPHEDVGAGILAVP